MRDLKICIIIAYFGKLPNTIDLWLKSCEYNPKIDFIVCSDCVKENLPNNVKWLRMSFEQFREMVIKKLGMQVKLDTPYECCDLKAVYGTVFEDYLVGYDYWGYCDMDMVFGDLSWFFNKYDLSSYDRFLSLGHLSLMRNTEENNNRYKLPCTPRKGYKDAFITSGSTHFCEEEINNIFLAYGYPIFKDRIYADINTGFHRMRIAGYIKDYHYQTFFWQNGKVWRAYMDRYTTTKNSVIELEEFMYIHFQKRKMKNPTFDISKTDAFYITSDSFVEKKELRIPSLKEIEELNPYKAIKETIEFITIKFKRRIR